MKVKSYIEFEFDTDNMDEDFLNEFAKDPVQFQTELKQYAEDSLIDDIYNAVKFNELGSYVRSEVING